MIRHTVLFRLTRPVGSTATDEFVAALRPLASAPPFALRPGTISVNAGLRTEGVSVADLSFVVEFVDVDSFAAYLADAGHQALVDETLRPRIDSMLSLNARVAEPSSR